MIFIEKKITKKFMEKLLDFAFTLRGNIVVLWSYPIENQKNSYAVLKEELKSSILEMKDLEPVTKYEGKDSSVKTIHCRLTPSTIKTLAKSFKYIIDDIDSISIYRENEKEWFFCSIFHEQMSLARLLNSEVVELKSNDIPYSCTPPDWW